MLGTAAPQTTYTRPPTTTARPVMMLEFNELSPTLMKRFIAEGHLPNFKRLADSSRVFVTDAEEAAPNLEPWIQWVTIHSGLTYDEHGIFHLGDGHKLSVKCLWDLLSAAGRRVWVCGSMNLRFEAPINGAVLPDPWATGSPPYPDAFAPYFSFVQRNVQEYTNDRVPLSAADYLAFVKFMLSHGLTLSTAIDIVGQLVRERVTGRARWQRATILDRLQWDVFKHYYKQIKPDLATFFLNSTAHFQHMHWRNMDPTPFSVKPTEEEQEEFGDAILYGYKRMDRIVGEALQLAGPDTTIMLLSALSQQPCLIYEDIGGKTFYRPRVFERLLEFVGAPESAEIAPVMSEQFHLHFGSESEAEAVAESLRALRVDGKPAMLVERKGSSVFTGCCRFEQLSHEAVLEAGPGGRQLPFFRLFYQVEGRKSGMHHPDGILWVRAAGLEPGEDGEKVPLRNLAPTILALCGMDKPAYMSGEPVLAEGLGLRTMV